VWRSALSPLALVVAICAACGAAPSPHSDREWKANAHGAVRQLREDIVLAANVDAEQALHDESTLYTALVVFTDFGGCRHMVAVLGSIPPRLGPAVRRLRAACTELQRAAGLFTLAVRRTSVALLNAAIETAQRALVPLDQAGLALRGG
jgi:hypothetical protein